MTLPLQPHSDTTLLHHDAPSPLSEPVTPIIPPVYHGAAYTYNDAHALSRIYQSQQKGFTYARTGSPNAQGVEKKITLLEKGHAALTFTTGMAAYNALFFTLLQQGSHVVASHHLFANTMSLLKSYQKFGVMVDWVDASQKGALAQAVQANTVLLLLETVANPCTQIPQWDDVQTLQGQYPHLIVVVDGTITTPLGFCARDVGAHLVIHSVTKSMMGHSRGLGGVIVDTGLMDWTQHPQITKNYRSFGKDAYIMQLRKKGLRDLGATFTAQHADLAAIGLETLGLRVTKANDNAKKIAQFLVDHPYVTNVQHPSLPAHPQHHLAKKYYTHAGFLLSFELMDGMDPFAFLAHLKYIKHCSSLGDNRSLIIHVASTIFAELSAQEQHAMSITPQTLRLSVGIEEVADIMADIEQAIGLLPPNI